MLSIDTVLSHCFSELNLKAHPKTSLVEKGPSLTQSGADGYSFISAKHREGAEMSVRLVVTVTAAPGKGTELAQVMKARCEECMKEPGCEQFEIFQSALNPDKLALLE